MLKPRCVDAKVAAKYCGVSAGTLMRHGPEPIRIGNRKVYDLDALDRWLDKKSGVSPSLSQRAGNDAEAKALAAIFGS